LQELIRHKNWLSTNNKMHKGSSIEKWRNENNDMKSTLEKIFNKSLNKIKDGIIKAQKNLEKIEVVEGNTIGVLVHQN